MKYRALSGLIALTLLAGCASEKKEVPDLPAHQLYSEANASMQSGEWTNAVEKLEALDSRYPFGPYSHQVQLDLIYVYYKNDEYALSLATIDRFMRLNPTHPKMDWVLYMRGLNHMMQDTTLVHDVLNIDRSDRDPEPAKAAFADFKKLLTQYPNSVYAKDAQRRAMFVKNRLAKYYIAVADFYLRREAWIAAINRCQELQKMFPDTQAARDSLRIQLKAYQELGLTEAVQRTEKLIQLNPA